MATSLKRILSTHSIQQMLMNEIRIGNKVPSDIGLHDFQSFVLEKVPKVKTYKFFITENQIVLCNSTE